MTLQLMAPLKKEMEDNGLTRVFEQIEMPPMPVLARMERNGVRLDTEQLAETGRNFNERLAEIEKEVYALAGHEFLITSPRQVGEVLFDELKLNEKAKKTKSGQYSTGEEVLEALRTKHPIVGKILAHRALKKLISTYVDALPKLINPKTGRIHTSFNQAVTATGRLSSSNPNLQNIPVRGEDGREIRKAFVPEEGCVFFSADYSQIELRIMAHPSEDEHLVQDFREGRDIHAATAARVFHKPIDEVTRDERRKAKTANFGIIYGISAFGMAERMEVSRAEAKELITNYFSTYPKVKEYMEQRVNVAREKGYIVTEFGRRRYLPDLASKNAVVRGYAERNAVNAPIRGYCGRHHQGGHDSHRPPLHGRRHPCQNDSSSTRRIELLGADRRTRPRAAHRHRGNGKCLHHACSPHRRLRHGQQLARGALNRKTGVARKLSYK